MPPRLIQAAGLALAAVRLAAAESGLPPGMPPGEFFAQRIRPVLAERCWRCHGERKQRAGLRLDSLAAVLAGGRAVVVVPGRPEDSRLVDAITYEDGDLQMPPDGQLPTAQVADIVTWIRAGVPWDGAGPATVATAAGGATRPAVGPVPPSPPAGR